MRVRAIYAGVMGGIAISVPLWLIMHYIWPSRLQEELKSPTWIELTGYLIAFLLILFTGGISAKWSWSKNWIDYIASGCVSGLIIGCISYNLIGSAGMGLMGNREIVQSLGKAIASQEEGVTYITYAVISTARWVYGGFWAFLFIGIFGGSIGGILARLYSPNALGPRPRSKNKWLSRLAVYIFVLSGFVSYIISSAVFYLLFENIRKSVEESNFLSPILSHSTDTAVALVSMTTAFLLYIPLAITFGWTVSEWKIRKHHFFSYIWFFLCAVIVLCNVNSLSFNEYYIVAGIATGIIVYAIFRTKGRSLTPDHTERYVVTDWLAFSLFVAVIGGTQLFAGMVPYSFSVALLTIFNIPHFIQNQIVEQSTNSQIDRLYALLSSFGLMFFLISGGIGLITGLVVLFVKKVFFYDDYFESIVLQANESRDRGKDMGSQKPTIFVSYSHADSTFVDQLIDDLRKEDLSIWIDKWMIHVGESITDKINEGLGMTDYLIIVLSSSSVNSKWVREELNSGLMRNIEQGKRAYILPILIEECNIPPLLAHRKYANFKDNYEVGFSELLETIRYQKNP